MLCLQHMQQQMRPLRIHRHHQFPKQRIRPSKPRPSEPPHIVLVKRLVHEPGPGMARLEHRQAAQDLGVVRAGHRLHRQRDRPDHAQPAMRPADPAPRPAAEEKRVVLAQHEGAGGAVARIVHGQAAQVGQRQQARHVRIVHVERIAVAVDFIGQYPLGRQRHPARWSGATRDWSHIDVVTLNPERDEVVTTAVCAQHTQQHAA